MHPYLVYSASTARLISMVRTPACALSRHRRSASDTTLPASRIKPISRGDLSSGACDKRERNMQYPWHAAVSPRPYALEREADCRSAAFFGGVGTRRLAACPTFCFDILGKLSWSCNPLRVGIRNWDRERST